MNKQPKDIEKILPFGETLRGFMKQSFIGKNDLRDVLRSRGIFTHNNEKQNTIPILMSITLSPDEFDQLRECQHFKEDNPKIITQMVTWDSEMNLIESLPDYFDINSILDLEFSNFKVTGSPNFVPVEDNPDYVKMDFKVERKDHTKNWASNKNIFFGSLELEKINNGKKVRLLLTYTAKETMYVAKKVSQNIVKHFKNKGCINEASIVEKILFSKFSNTKRIEYFMALTKNCVSDLLFFSDIIDIAFSPDKEKSLPDGMDWMEKKIEDLKLNGRSLHQTFFVKEKKYHEFIHLYKVDSCFKFDIKGLRGRCVISMGFPDYAKMKVTNSEMEVNVKSMSFDSVLKGNSKNNIKKILLKDLEIQKIKNFKSLTA